MGQRRLYLKHATPFFLFSVSGIIGSLHLLPLCAFLVCTEAAFPFLPLKQYDSLLFSRLLFKWEQDRQCTFNVTSRPVRNIVLHILNVCLWPYFSRMQRPYIFASLACPAVPHFSTLSHKRHDFRKRLLNIKCVLISSRKFVWNSKKSRVRYD
jgi:hypothetical protein